MSTTERETTTPLPPFYTSPPELVSPLARVYEISADLIEAGWTRNSEINGPPTKPRYCITGAVREASARVGKNTKERRSLYGKAISYFGKNLPGTYEYQSAETKAIFWNDQVVKSKKPIVRRFREFAARFTRN